MVNSRRSSASQPPGPTASLGAVGLLGIASVVTFGVLWLASPGLRADVAQVIVVLSRLDAAALQGWFASFGPWAWLIYFLVVVAQVIAAPIPSTPVIFAGALVFGVGESFALSLAGSLVGSVVVFAAVRRWGTPLLVRVFGRAQVDAYAGRLDDRGWWLLLILLVPLLPDDLASALAGLSALSLRRFVLITLVGRVPAIATAALLASDAVTSSMTTAVTAGTAVLAVLVLGLTYRARLEHWILSCAQRQRHDE